MPPQVGKAGEGGRSIPANTVESSQEVKSSEVRKKSAEQKDSASNDSTPRRATAKETSSRKTELAMGGASQQSTLSQKLKKAKEDPIVIQGTRRDDNVHVSRASGLLGQLGMIEVDVNGKKKYVTQEEAEKMEIRTGSGNDVVVIDSRVKQGIKVDGGRGDDTLIGGSGNDVLVGGRGKDVIFGRGGNDTITGGAGNDSLHGGKGHDAIAGGKGKDFIDGGKGMDLILDGSKNDTIKNSS